MSKTTSEIDIAGLRYEQNGKQPAPRIGYTFTPPIEPYAPWNYPVPDFNVQFNLIGDVVWSQNSQVLEISNLGAPKNGFDKTYSSFIEGKPAGYFLMTLSWTQTEQTSYATEIIIADDHTGLSIATVNKTSEQGYNEVVICYNNSEHMNDDIVVKLNVQLSPGERAEWKIHKFIVESNPTTFVLSRKSRFFNLSNNDARVYKVVAIREHPTLKCSLGKNCTSNSKAMLQADLEKLLAFSNSAARFNKGTEIYGDFTWLEGDAGEFMAYIATVPNKN